MAPAVVVAAKIVAYLFAHPEVVRTAIKAAQELFGDLPGESRFGVVKGFITEAMDDTDPDDKTWEKGWRIARPFFNLFVAKVKGKVIAAAEGGA